MLREHANEDSGVSNNEHDVAAEFENANDETVNQSDMSSNCNNCHKYKELDEIKLKVDTLLSRCKVVDIKQNESERNVSKLIDGEDGVIEMLLNQNRKLACELDIMKVTLEQVKLDNE